MRARVSEREGSEGWEDQDLILQLSEMRNSCSGPKPRDAGTPLEGQRAEAVAPLEISGQFSAPMKALSGAFDTTGTGRNPASLVGTRLHVESLSRHSTDRLE